MKDYKELWEDFGNVPINDNDETEREFLHFPIGTDKTDIWYWFEEKFNIRVHDLLYKQY